MVFISTHIFARPFNPLQLLSEISFSITHRTSGCAYPGISTHEEKNLVELCLDPVAGLMSCSSF